MKTNQKLKQKQRKLRFKQHNYLTLEQEKEALKHPELGLRSMRGLRKLYQKHIRLAMQEQDPSNGYVYKKFRGLSGY